MKVILFTIMITVMASPTDDTARGFSCDNKKRLDASQDAGQDDNGAIVLKNATQSNLAYGLWLKF